MTKWHNISRNERTITIGDRHYFASRCNGQRLWRIDEMDQAQINGSRSLGIVADHLTTHELTAWAKNGSIDWKTVCPGSRAITVAQRAR